MTENDVQGPERLAALLRTHPMFGPIEDDTASPTQRQLDEHDSAQRRQRADGLATWLIDNGVSLPDSGDAPRAEPTGAAIEAAIAAIWLYTDSSSGVLKVDGFAKDVVLTALKAAYAVDRASAPAELFEQLKSALAEARSLIAAYHGEPGWADYQYSPEMKRINSAMAAACDVAALGSAPREILEGAK